MAILVSNTTIRLLCCMMLIGLSNSCFDYRSNDLNDQLIREISQPVRASEEEVSIVERDKEIDYERLVEAAYGGDDSSIEMMLRLRLNHKYLWDGSAVEGYSENMRKIIFKYGDEKFAHLLTRVGSVNYVYLLKVIFPSGDDGKLIPFYREIFPVTYKVLSAE